MSLERKKKSPALTMIVNVAGKKFKEKNSTETFLSVLRFLGPETIAAMKDIKVDGLPLIVPNKDYRMQMNKLDDNYYVCTHMPTTYKKRLLERVAERLNIDIRIVLKQSAKLL